MLKSPYLPTPTELLLLALYPVTLILGSAFTTFSPYLYPPSNLSTYSSTHQSYQPPYLAPSYFATKRNIFNLYFVKIGWFWSTVALFTFTVLAARGRAAIDVGVTGGDARRERILQRKGARMADLDDTAARHERDARLRRVYQVVVRWLLLTAAWGITTQWFFGGGIIDRVFQATGGACYTVARDAPGWQQYKAQTDGVIEGVGSYAECRRRGGRFRGGLDISGHVFLLVLSSGMVFAEALPVVLPWVSGLTGGRLVRCGRETREIEDEAERYAGEKREGVEPLAHSYETRRASRVKLAVEAQSQSREKALTTRLKDYALWLTAAVVVLSWWMLLMTAAFFHTWVEKGSALIVSISWLYAVYVAPRASEGVRGVVGMPGV